jgi:hypothetical protein
MSGRFRDPVERLVALSNSTRTPKNSGFDRKTDAGYGGRRSET